MSQLIKAFFIIFIFNVLFVLPYLGNFDVICDDAAVILGSSSIKDDWGLHLFHTAYGPKVIRPFQIIGMYWEDLISSRSAMFSHILTFVWCALAQTISCAVLAPFIGIFGATLALLFTSFSIFAAEPLYWLSDRHDIYLYLFAALTFFFAIKFLRGSKTWLPFFAAVFFQWGAFFSNEKAVALPLLLSLWAVILKLIQSEIKNKRVLALVTTAALNLALYLLLRFLVIGELVGGYNNTVIPKKTGLISLLLHWSETLLVLPFRQISIEQGQFFVLLAVPCILIALYNLVFFERKVALTGIGLFLSIFIASAPTLQYSLGGLEAGVLSTRLFWFPYLIWAVALAALFTAALRNSNGLGQGAVLMGALILVLGVTWGGRSAANAYSKAYNYSNKAVALFGENCSCADPAQIQATGLPGFPFSVTTFTEDIWIQNNAIYKGMPRCSSEDSQHGELCRVRFEDALSEPLVIPVRQSYSKLKALLPKGELSLAAWGADNYPTPRFEITEFKMKQTPEDKNIKELSLRGWARERDSKKAPSLFVLYLNDHVIAAIPPNIFRLKTIKSENENSSRTKLGFAFSIKLPPELGATDQITLLAFNLGEDVPLHSSLFSKSVKEL